MSLLAKDLSVIQGQDANFGPFTFASPDPSGFGNFANQVYVNFTNATARMQVRALADAGSALLLSLRQNAGIVFASVRTPGGPPAPAYNNSFQINISASVLLALAPGQYVYDVFVDWSDGTHTEFVSGTFTVLSSVSR